MKLLFKQRLFSWLDSYDIYDEAGNVVYRVEGKISFGHKLFIYNHNHEHIATIKEEVLTLLSRFSMYINEQYIGCIQEELSFFKPKFQIDCNNWRVEGDFWQWDYQIVNQQNQVVGTINKDIFHVTDTYNLTITNPQDALYVLMIVLAIDAQKCTRNK